MIEQLRRIELLAHLSDERLEPWAQAAETRHVPAGTVLVDADAPPIGLVLLFDGTIEGLLPAREGFEPEVDHVAPTWIGAIPTLLQTPSPIRMLACSDLRVAIVEPARLRSLVFDEPSVFDLIMAQVKPVLARFGDAERTRERLASLGTIAAGLAHELNNPTSAARRAAADLAGTDNGLGAVVAALLRHQVDPDDLDALPDGSDPTSRSALEIADAEDALMPVLEELDLTEPWRLAASLAAAGVDPEQARRLAARSGPALLHWLASRAEARLAASDLESALTRVSELVGAMQTYTYLDRGAVIELAIHQGLDATLTVLGREIDRAHITVQRDYAPELPNITAFGAELNQVWTKLIENAVLAATPGGTVTIATRLAGGCVEVDVTDSGPGIPFEIRDRIFDPFYTTRDVGQGAGLGLHIARHIVVTRHGGSLTVSSEPGRTTLRTRLPVQTSDVPS
jgi:signal transduction histidine kinase